MDATLGQYITITYVFHFVEFKELICMHMLIHHMTDTCSESQRASALSSERADSEIAHLLEMIAFLETPFKLEVDAYMPVTDIPHNLTGQAIG